MKWHFNPKTGDAKICHASVKECPLGSDNHFNTLESAFRANYDNLPKMSKEDLQDYRDDSLALEAEEKKQTGLSESAKTAAHPFALTNIIMDGNDLGAFFVPFTGAVDVASYPLRLAYAAGALVKKSIDQPRLNEKRKKLDAVKEKITSKLTPETADLYINWSLR